MKINLKEIYFFFKSLSINKIAEGWLDANFTLTIMFANSSSYLIWASMIGSKKTFVLVSEILSEIE